MARVGISDFAHSYQAPHQRAQYWREVINRSTWDHAFHPLSERLPKPGYKNLCSTAKDGQAQPWKHLRNSFHVGCDDQGMAYLDGRQQPRGLSKEDRTLRPVNVMATQLPRGQDPLQIATLPNTLRCTRTSGALPMAAKLSTMRGDTDLGKHDKVPSCRAPNYSYGQLTLPGWGSSSAPSLGLAKRERAPTFTRVLNV
eukprot:TRINITY_DN1006_c0_g2_i4.p1 TRINITY_DN1006_c0_g2~~TRINITY_DN1006_c0_g2_i4.p1  ORF type:complete len:198 (-),score=6.46 TRINITY_DN1006_c0_g2_i4:39-632(-)